MRRTRWVIVGLFATIAARGLAGTLPQPERTVRVTPDVVYRIYRLSAPRAVVHVLEVSLKGTVELAAVKPGIRLTSCAPLSEMLKAAGQRVIAGVNGDFFSEVGAPIGPHVCDGDVVKSGPTRPVIGMTSSGEIFLTVDRLQADVQFPRGEVMQVSGFNRARSTDELIVFNRWFGRTTRTNRWGVEVTLAALVSPQGSGPLLTVVTRVDTVGNSIIPPGGMVLSGHGRVGQALRQACRVQDTLRLSVALSSAKGTVRWLVSGGPLLLREGRVAFEEIASWGNGGFALGRHPRTAAGLSADRSTAYLVTVDGRQPGYSEGMSLVELAEFLVDLGAFLAINFDGGGSTTMVIQGKVVNRPAGDGQERPVSNALVVRYKAWEEP
ncbi:MAG: phosphodiester glycosidase family protein [candidate division KSB1 bacterium]|nr:phosphodiester glycosidase family protein [candidate division KSB1 bacterium]MDZ7386319.1 phosphodiester glycosidase family protein [candidate division KSB1 bacterium]MDZ7413202.1 phosphodiester glycosidase family protein [candidate division KSB1 bacterium]